MPAPPPPPSSSRPRLPRGPRARARRAWRWRPAGTAEAENPARRAAEAPPRPGGSDRSPVARPPRPAQHLHRAGAGPGGQRRLRRAPPPRTARSPTRHADAQTARHELDQHHLRPRGSDARARGDPRVVAGARSPGSRLASTRWSARSRSWRWRPSSPGTRTTALNEAIASETPATNEAERRDVLAGISMDVLLAERAAYQARIDAAAERAEQAVTDLGRGPGDAGGDRRRPPVRRRRRAGQRPRRSPRSGSPTRRPACSPRSRASSSPSSRSTPTTAPPTTVADERPTCGVEWWGLAGHLAGRGPARHLRRHHPHAQRRHGQADHRHPAQRHQLHRGDRRHRRRHARRRRRATTAPSGRCSSSRRRGGASRPTATRTARRRRSTSTTRRSPPPPTCAPRAAASTPIPGCGPPTSPTTTPLLYVDSVLGYARLYERSIEVPERAPDRGRPPLRAVERFAAFLRNRADRAGQESRGVLLTAMTTRSYGPERPV